MGRYWEGILVGNDGYPKNDNICGYLIAGGKDEYFKATAIEFYGVNWWWNLIIIIYLREFKKRRVLGFWV